MSERCLSTSHVLCAGDGKERRRKSANQVCRDQDGESLICISDRDSAGTYLRFHTSPHVRAYACACHARPSPPSSIRANHAIQRHCSARAYPSNSPRNHSRRTIYSDYFHYYMYIPFFIRGRTHTRMHPLFADALSMCQLIMRHAVATIVPAPRCPRACCPLRTSRYVACHARRRCDGPCEWVAFRVRMSTHACRVM